MKATRLHAPIRLRKACAFSALKSLSGISATSAYAEHSSGQAMLSRAGLRQERAASFLASQVSNGSLADPYHRTSVNTTTRKHDKWYVRHAAPTDPRAKNPGIRPGSSRLRSSRPLVPAGAPPLPDQEPVSSSRASAASARANRSSAISAHMAMKAALFSPFSR